MPQYPFFGVDPGITPLFEAGDVVYGTTATLLTPPTGFKEGWLIVQAQSGSFNIRAGDKVSAGMPAALNPTAGIMDGTAGLQIRAGETRAFKMAGEDCKATVKGYAGTDSLYYTWAKSL